MKIIKKCQECKTSFLYRNAPSDKAGKFCSRKCTWKAMGRNLKGKKQSKETIEKRLATFKMFYDGHPNWKGDKAGYHAKHKWVQSKFGRPRKCVFCETKEIRRYEWANISGEYKRERNDWLRLCSPCHAKFDNKKQKVQKAFALKREARNII